ncbi:hypothetical protein PFISCL1PPCAC_49, partial [Pristionchus fissidentatus]
LNPHSFDSHSFQAFVRPFLQPDSIPTSVADQNILNRNFSSRRLKFDCGFGVVDKVAVRYDEWHCTLSV